MTNESLDAANAQFWNELCGTGLARHLGLTDHSLPSLKRFDDYYLEVYPYLLSHVPVHSFAGLRVLEVRLGYGTLGQKIAEAGASYVGLDIAEGPVRMMNHRLRLQGIAGEARQGNMLQCPLPDESVDRVVSIGCFHHTGDTRRCIDETFRVLRPGGSAYVMLYNKFSWRRWTGWPGPTLRALFGTLSGAADDERKAYDANAEGRSAPEVAFFSKSEVRRMFRRFRNVRVDKENCDPMMFRGRMVASREALLSTVGRWAGLDLYIAAEK